MPADNVALVGALPSQATTSQFMSYDEANAFEQEKALDDIEHGADDVDNITMLPPSTIEPFPIFNPLRQPTFTPSTPGASTIATSESGKSVESQHVSIQEALQDMNKELHNLKNTFNRATDVFQKYTTQVASLRNSRRISRPMVDPIPVRKQRAIIQLQEEEGLDDHQIVEIIKHLQADVSIADTYLAIEKGNIRKLFLLSYLQ